MNREYGYDNLLPFLFWKEKLDMDLMESIKLYEKAESLVFKEKSFDEPMITFVIVKKLKNKNKLIIGVTEHNEDYVYHAYGKKKILRDDQIRYKDEYQLSGICECIEGHILSSLNDGYELAYMDLSYHCCMWNFIADDVNGVMNMMKAGVYSYLLFCNITGINHILLEYYSQSEMVDIEFMLVENSFDDYDLLLSEFIGEKRVMLGFQERIVLDPKTKKGKLEWIYRVIVADINTLEIEYSDYHSMIENAFADYNNHFFALSLSYYQSKETDNNRLVEDFKQIAAEPLY